MNWKIVQRILIFKLKIKIHGNEKKEVNEKKRIHFCALCICCHPSCLMFIIVYWTKYSWLHYIFTTAKETFQWQERKENAWKWNCENILEKISQFSTATEKKFILQSYPWIQFVSEYRAYRTNISWLVVEQAHKRHVWPIERNVKNP